MTRYANSHGAFEIDSLPGQSQVAVCHGFFVDQAKRNLGHGHLGKRLQNKSLRALRYDYAVCTVAAGNAAQKTILARAGWSKLSEFTNRRSGETTELWGAQP